MRSNQHYHLAGVAGSGMNPLAQALLCQGYRVTGSDRYFDQGTDVPVIAKLQAAGVDFFPQDGSALNPNCAGLVVSTAIEDDNPELLAAQTHGVAVLHRSEMLAELVRDKRCIAIAGTSGKTTTTGMVGYVLATLGLDPTVVNGGVIVNWADDQQVGNVRSGNSPLWVIEADESDRSLLNYAPEWAIVNTISMDHFSLEETIALFREFAGKVQKGIVCGPGVKQQLEGATAASLVELNDLPTGCELRMPGQHNEMNARATATLCTYLGGHPTAIQSALATFQGIERRLQRVGHSAIPVYDDFGHNPEKIRAAIDALASAHQRLWVSWKPHGFGPLKAMADEIQAMLLACSDINLQFFVLPVYYAGGTTSRAMESDAFVEQLTAAGVPATYAPDYDWLTEHVCAAAQPGDAILSMGARDPALPRFAAHMADRLSDP